MNFIRRVTLGICIYLCLLGDITALTGGLLSQRHLYSSTLRPRFSTNEAAFFPKVPCSTCFIDRKCNAKKGEEDLDEIAKKQGLEVAMFKSVTSKDSSTLKPADLLKKYGVAYLATSISLAIVSFSICYVLVSQGIDVTSLLKKIGIDAGDTAANAGTIGIAYAVHKAASPIRFPPTVALTPIVAGWIGKEIKEDDQLIKNDEQNQD